MVKLIGMLLINKKISHQSTDDQSAAEKPVLPRHGDDNKRSDLKNKHSSWERTVGSVQLQLCNLKLTDIVIL